MEKVIISWSGGKDSAMALYEALRSNGYDVLALLTTVNEYHDRISMHGVRRTLLEHQAASVGINLEKVFLSKDGSNEEYESRIMETLMKYAGMGASSVIFGDIFLEDLRKYREDNLSKAKMKGVFPIWKRDTAVMAEEFIKLGFKAIITCVDTSVLDKKYSGREFDAGFLSELPSEVDPCGENGEFHSFVYDGPIFSRPVKFRTGRTVTMLDRFCFTDLVPL